MIAFVTVGADDMASRPPSLPMHQFQAKPCRCSRRVASIIERIGLGGASNLMRVLVSLTAPSQARKIVSLSGNLSLFCRYYILRHFIIQSLIISVDRIMFSFNN